MTFYLDTSSHFTDQQQQHIRTDIHLKQIIFPIYSLALSKNRKTHCGVRYCENSLNTRPKPKSTISGASRAIHHKYWIFRFSLLYFAECFPSIFHRAPRRCLFWVFHLLLHLILNVTVRQLHALLKFSRILRAKARVAVGFWRFHFHQRVATHVEVKKRQFVCCLPWSFIIMIFIWVLGSLTFDVLFAGCCCRPLSRFRFGFSCFCSLLLRRCHCHYHGVVESSLLSHCGMGREPSFFKSFTNAVLWLK